MSIQSIADFFREHNLKWKFDDGYRVPTLDELDEAITKAIDKLADEPDMTQIEFGRLVCQRNGSAYDIYVLIHSEPITP